MEGESRWSRHKREEEKVKGEDEREKVRGRELFYSHLSQGVDLHSIRSSKFLQELKFPTRGVWDLVILQFLWPAVGHRPHQRCPDRCRCPVGHCCAVLKNACVSMHTSGASPTNRMIGTGNNWKKECNEHMIADGFCSLHKQKFNGLHTIPAE